MRAWGNFGNLDQSTILFCRKDPRRSNLSIFSMKKNIDSNPQKLFLLSKFCEFPIFETIPKHFSISTKNGTSFFNTYMLQEVSPVISEHLQNKPTELNYFLNINDEENALSKFEQLFKGETVIFDEDELPSSQRITKMLQIKNCPNYLKPESLRINEIYSNGNRISSYDTPSIKTGVIIQERIFVNYLKSERHQKFKIKTNRNEYKCNIFGIYSSNVIRQFLEKDSTIDEFVFDYEDEDDEFQLICDFFNFKQVDIKSDNMELLKEFAETLQINCIIKQVDNYINNYEKFSQKVDEQQTIIDSIDHLFDLLYNIKKYGIEKVKISIAQSEWSQSIKKVQELAASIIQVIKPNFYLNREMAELLIQLNNEANESNKLNILMPFIIKKLMDFYMPKPLYLSKVKGKKESFKTTISMKGNNNSKYVFSFIFILYKRGVISRNEIIEKLKNYNFSFKILNAFFLPELIELYPNNLYNILRNQNNNPNFVSFVQKYLPDKIDLYKKMLENMEPDDDLTKSLIHDDVDTLQSIITRNEIDIANVFVPYNIFDDLDENPTLINYSCLYGSVKCFKYLLLNNAKIDESSLYYAVYGGNSEIIKIVDQRMPIEDEKKSNSNNNSNLHNRFGLGFGRNSNNNTLDNDRTVYYKTVNGRQIYCLNLSNDDNIIQLAIMMHRNDLFDWLFERKFVSKSKIGNELNNIAVISASNGNAHSLVEIIDKGADISSTSAIYSSASNGFCKLTKLLLSIENNQKVKKESSDFIDDSYYQEIVQFENLSIFKLFESQMNQSKLGCTIVYAIQLGCKKIIDYFFDNLDKLKFKLNVDFVKTALKESFISKDDQLFNFLIDKFKKLSSEFINLNLYEDLIDGACLYANLKATETITDIIFNENPKYDFSSAFINASSSGSMNICRYFIDKKVYINCDNLSESVSEFGLIDAELFELILKKANPSIKNKFLKCIDQAIRCRNKKLIEFLLKEKAPIKNALFEAVKTGDVEIVDIVLKYNSKPSFINQKNNLGTVLHIAVVNKNLTIVKRLLLIPGIDPSLLNHQNNNPLVLAIKQYSYEIMEAILDFYGDDIQPQIWELYQELIDLSNMISANNVDPLLWKIIKRILEIKSIDPNFCFDQTNFLCKACYSNEFKIVKDLLSIEKVDVNKYETISYQTPLMIAINNRNEKLAELLINHPKTDINMRNIDDQSALHIAVKKNLINIVELLIKSDKFDPIESGLDYSFYLANVDIAKVLINSSFLDINQTFEFNNQDGQLVETTALIHSVQINDVEKIEMIINHPLFNKEQSNIQKAIFTAAENNNIEVFKCLIKLIDNNINIMNSRLCSLLAFAASHLSGEIIDEIFRISKTNPIKSESVLIAFVSAYSSPANNNKSDVVEIMNKIFMYDSEHSKSIDFKQLLPKGLSFFTTISTNYDGLKEVVDFLIDHGADPNIPDKFGYYPLQIAIIMRSIDFIDSLMNSNKIDYSKVPYLHSSVIGYDFDQFKYILDKNVIDINLTDDEGNTALIVACRLNKAGFVNLLFQKENLDYLHRNKNGLDALQIVKSLPDDEYNEAIKSKEAYHKKLISIIDEKND